MKRTDTVIIGGGQAGLAMSRCLSDRGIEHVVLERGRLAERWRSERWDSLRLLTPNWQSRLPGWHYRGADPNGFMTCAELVRYFERYAHSFSAPLQCETTVLSVRSHLDGYRVETDQGSWQTDHVVIATGHAGIPFVPTMARDLDSDIHQLVPSYYRNPSQLPDGGVLVVGASASGLQLADEIHRSGREVTLAVGRHTRLPRHYRGRDIMHWLDVLGTLDERAHAMRNLAASRNQPSLQLVGRPDHSSLDLPILERAGVRLVGRTRDACGHQMRFARDLPLTTAAADAKLNRILTRIDRFATRAGLKLPEAERPSAFTAPAAAEALDLRDMGIRTVLWATGFRRRYPWLKVPVFDSRGEIRQHGGITPAPGIYTLGLMFMRRRNSYFIDGVGQDAQELADTIAARLAGPQSAAA
jgi:putative flavoprotein involved in K+ transport